MIYTVLVKPNSKKGPLVIEKNGELTVYLREKPVEGKANMTLIKILAKHFGVAKGCVVIKSGAHGRKKLIEIL